jgi:predicted DCC family thiol-disulfide oxidoreductase YuxK
MKSTLPDPDQSPGTDVVIYDGDCRFCTSGVAKLRMLDCCGNRLSYISLHDPRVSQRYPDLSHEQLMEQMFVVDQKGNQHGGSDAVRFLSRRLPLLWPAMPVLHFPGTAGLWRWGYYQVAKRRYLIAGRNDGCEDGACAVHLKPRHSPRG